MCKGVCNGEGTCKPACFPGSRVCNGACKRTRVCNRAAVVQQKSDVQEGSGVQRDMSVQQTVLQGRGVRCGVQRGIGVQGRATGITHSFPRRGPRVRVQENGCLCEAHTRVQGPQAVVSVHGWPVRVQKPLAHVCTRSSFPSPIDPCAHTQALHTHSCTHTHTP